MFLLNLEEWPSDGFNIVYIYFCHEYPSLTSIIYFPPRTDTYNLSGF